MFRFFFLIIGRPPRPPLFPYTTLSRSSSSRKATQLPAASASPRFRARDNPGSSVRSSRAPAEARSEEHTSELQSRQYLVCRLLLEKKKKYISNITHVHHVSLISCIILA